jgi:hypothetical protein
MNKHHDIRDIQFIGNILEITIDGITTRCALQTLSPLLAQASETERTTFEISPSGYGIHWPLLDEDISIDALLGIVNAPARDRKTA